MKKLALILIVVLATVVVATAQGGNKKPASPSWATLQQWADAEVKSGGIYGRDWGEASPKLKWISKQMILMKFGANGWRALCFAQRESGLNPAALSRTNDHHLFQLNWSAHHNTFDYERLDRYDVGYGIQAAFSLSRGGRDFSPWAGGTYSC